MTNFNKSTKEVQKLFEMQEKIVKILGDLVPLADDAEVLNDYNALEMAIRTRIQEAEDDLAVARAYLYRRLDDLINGKNQTKD